MVFVDFLIFLIALAVLIKASDILVNSASSLAITLGISEFIIGLTVVSIGTSIPELAAGISASLLGDSKLIIGTILGSNIANIGLVLGIASIISILKIDKIALYRDGIFLISSSILFVLMAFDGEITRLEGLMLIVLFIGYIYHLIRSKPKDKFGYEQYIQYLWKIINPVTYIGLMDKTIGLVNSRNERNNEKKSKLKSPLLIRQALSIIFSLAVIIIASGYLIPSASRIASDIGISETIIGFFMIAIGTSLPELIVSLTSIYRKLNNILVGNIIGSNIANLMMVGGVSATIRSISVDNLALFYIMPFMIFLTLLLLQFIRTNWFIRKLEGIAFLIIYFAFSIFLFFVV